MIDTGSHPPMAEIVKQLPPELRTEQWYCDLHHALFLIFLHDARRALLGSQEALAEYFIDTIAVYWLVHSLMEEEGMAYALANGEVCADHVAAHAQAHVALTQVWFRDILEPYKAGAHRPDVAAAVTGFYEQVVRHIATLDVATYGEASGRDEKAIRREVAHLSATGLPLSPQMAGSAALVERLAPRLKTLLSPRSVAPTWAAPMPTLSLAGWSTPLWTGGKGAFRDVIAHHHGALRLGSPQRPASRLALAA